MKRQDHVNVTKTRTKDAIDHLDEAITDYLVDDIESARVNLQIFCSRFIYSGSFIKFNKLVRNHALCLKDFDSVLYNEFLGLFYHEIGDMVYYDDRRRATEYWRRAKNAYEMAMGLYETQERIRGTEWVHKSLVMCLLKFGDFKNARILNQKLISKEFAIHSSLRASEDDYWIGLSNIALFYEFLAWCTLWLNENEKAERYHDLAYRIFSLIMDKRKPLVINYKLSPSKVDDKAYPWHCLVSTVTFCEAERIETRITQQHLLFMMQYYRLIIDSLMHMGLFDDALFGGWYEPLILCNKRTGQHVAAEKAAQEVADSLTKMAAKQKDSLESAIYLIGAGEFVELAKGPTHAIEYYMKAITSVSVDDILRSDDVELFLNMAERTAGIYSLMENHVESERFYRISADISKNLFKPEHFYSKGMAFFESALLDGSRKNLKRARVSTRMAIDCFSEADRLALGASSEDFKTAAQFRRNTCLAFDELLLALILRSEGLETFEGALINEAKSKFDAARGLFIGLSMLRRLSKRERDLLKCYAGVAFLEYLLTDVMVHRFQFKDSQSMQDGLAGSLNAIVSLRDLAEKAGRKKLRLWVDMLEHAIRRHISDTKAGPTTVKEEYHEIYPEAPVALKDTHRVVNEMLNRLPLSTPAPTCPIKMAPQNLIKIRVLKHQNKIYLDTASKLMIEMEKIANVERAFGACPLFIEYSIPTIHFRGRTSAFLPNQRTILLKMSINIPSGRASLIPVAPVTLCLRPIMLLGGSCLRQIGEEARLKVRLYERVKASNETAKDFVSRTLEIAFERNDFSRDREIFVEFRKLPEPHLKLIWAVESLLQRISESYQLSLHGTKEYAGVDISKKVDSAILGFQIKCRNDDLSEDKIRAQASKALEYGLDAYVLIYAVPRSKRVETSIQAAYHHFIRINKKNGTYCTIISPEQLARLFEKYDVRLDVEGGSQRSL